jgi:hypothetical protein
MPVISKIIAVVVHILLSLLSLLLLLLIGHDKDGMMSFSSTIRKTRSKSIATKGSNLQIIVTRFQLGIVWSCTDAKDLLEGERTKVPVLSLARARELPYYGSIENRVRIEVSLRI